MMKVNQKGFGVVEVLTVVVIMVLMGAVGWLIYDRQSNKSVDQPRTKTQTETSKVGAPKQEEVQPKALLKGSFGENGEFGTFQAEGYVTTVKLDEAFCEENCQQYDYAFFNITKSENTKIFEYINSNAGNSFVKDKAIGMGCVANGVISYSNSSDTVSKEYTISQSDTQKILAATKDKPIGLDIERLQYTGGRGAPTCYSHFATFKVIN